MLWRKFISWDGSEADRERSSHDPVICKEHCISRLIGNKHYFMTAGGEVPLRHRMNNTCTCGRIRQNRIQMTDIYNL